MNADDFYTALFMSVPLLRIVPNNKYRGAIRSVFSLQLIGAMRFLRGRGNEKRASE